MARLVLAVGQLRRLVRLQRAYRALNEGLLPSAEMADALRAAMLGGG